MRKLILAATAAATLAGGLAATATPAAAQPFYGYHRVYRPYRVYAPRPYYAPVSYGYGYRPYWGHDRYGYHHGHRW